MNTDARQFKLSFSERIKERDRKRDYRARKKAEKLAEEHTGQMQTILKPLVIQEGFDWIDANLIIPSGISQGKPFELHDWQKKWIYAIMQDGIREGGLSMPRKNGKTGLLAAFVLAFLAGPWNKPNWRAIAASVSARHVTELKESIITTAAASGLPVSHHRSPAPGRIEGLNNARIDFLAAERTTGHAVSADLSIIDEAGMLNENRRDLWDGMYSAISARDGKFICISIQSEGPMFAEMEADADQDHVHFVRHQASPDCEIMDEREWWKANPGLGRIKSLDYMRDAAAKAARSLAAEQAFRALELNQSVDPLREMICTTQQYERLITAARAPRGDVVLGIDLGANKSMSAVAVLELQTRTLFTYAALPTVPTLRERGSDDQVGLRYEEMHRQGNLYLTGKRETDVPAFLNIILKEILRESRIRKIGADGFRKAGMLDVLDAIKWQGKIEWRGTGSKHSKEAHHDITATQEAMMNETIKIVDNLIIRSAILEATVDRNQHDQARLIKRRPNGRIDALQAAVIAIGIATNAKKKRRARAAVV